MQGEESRNMQRVEYMRTKREKGGCIRRGRRNIESYQNFINKMGEEREKRCQDI